MGNVLFLSSYENEGRITMFYDLDQPNTCLKWIREDFLLGALVLPRWLLLLLLVSHCNWIFKLCQIKEYKRPSLHVAATHWMHFDHLRNTNDDLNFFTRLYKTIVTNIHLDPLFSNNFIHHVVHNWRNIGFTRCPNFKTSTFIDYWVFFNLNVMHIQMSIIRNVGHLGLNYLQCQWVVTILQIQCHAHPEVTMAKAWQNFQHKVLKSWKFLTKLCLDMKKWHRKWTPSLSLIFWVWIKTHKM